MTDAPTNQEQKILWLLQAAWPAWTPAPRAREDFTAVQREDICSSKEGFSDRQQNRDRRRRQARFFPPGFEACAIEQGTAQGANHFRFAL